MNETKEAVGLLGYSNSLEEEEDVNEYLSHQQQSRRTRFCNVNPLFFGLSIAALVLMLSLWSSSRSTAQEEYCRWQFDSYEPSAYEKEWASHAKEWQGDICSKLEEPLHAAASKSLVARALELYRVHTDVKWATQDNQPLVDYRKEDDFFSRMTYRRECYDSATGNWTRSPGKGQQLIEPLWGMLRDPMDLFCGKQRLHLDGWIDPSGQSKYHILPQGYSPYAYHESDSEEAFKLLQWRSHGAPPWIDSFAPSTVDNNIGTIWTAPKNVLIDLGSSYFGSWGESTNAASGAWMYQTFHQRGLKWQKYIAVEVEDLKATEAYRQLPADLVGVYTFMNIPLNVDEGDKLNIITILRAIAESNDHVVLKLDIDSANMELPFAYALRDDPSLGKLVSELFFEHHVDIIEMRPYWGTNLKEDLNDSYRLFHDLRSNGIRAHSWP